AYEASRSTRIPAPVQREAFASQGPNVEIVNVSCGHPVNLSYWGGPDYDFTFRSRDIVEVGRPEVEMIEPAGTSIHYATYRAVRGGGGVTGPLRMIFPSFITNRTRSVAVMSVVGSPGIAITSANLPFSSVPSFCATPINSAPLEVADRSASTGGIPKSTINLN